MPLLLVDDRDGRVVAFIETQDEALRILEGFARDDERLPSHICLVETGSRHGVLAGADTSVAIRPLA
jgi:hypothetical protein